MSKMKWFCGFTCGLLMMIVLGCASTSGAAPDWVTDPESAYSGNHTSKPFYYITLL